MNILSNAAKYTTEGEIKIKISLENIEIIKISVEDTGCGISEKN